MSQVMIDVTPSLKTFKLSGAFKLLRQIEEETSTWARWDDRTLLMPASRMAYNCFCRVIPENELSYTSDAKILVQGFETLTKSEIDTKKNKATDVVKVDDYAFGGLFDPWEHQKKAFLLSRDKPNFGLFMEMGTGKTRVIIDTAAYLYEQGKIDLCLVVAFPSAVAGQWVNEAVPTHMPERIPLKLWSRRPGRKISDDLFFPFDGLKFYSLNVEQFQVASGVKLINKILDSIADKRTLLVFDESSKFKSPQSKRTKAAWTVQRKASYRRILTGTPLGKGVHDFYAQFRLLDKDIIGANSFAAFKNRYCKIGGWEGRQIVGYQNVDELMSLVSGHTFRVRKTDCLDLPEKHFIIKPVDFHPEQKTLYNEMKKNGFLKLENGEILDGSTGIAKVLRLQQIASGHLPITKNEKTIGWSPVKNTRIDEVKHILSGVDGKTVVFAKFKADIAQLMDNLDETAIEYVSSRAEEVKRAFKEDDDIRVLVCQLDAGAFGLDLPHAQNIIYYSRGWSYEVDHQSRDRIHRGGQVNSCSYFYIQIPKSVDELIADVIDNAYDMAKKALDSDYVEQFI